MMNSNVVRPCLSPRAALDVRRRRVIAARHVPHSYREPKHTDIVAVASKPRDKHDCAILNTVGPLRGGIGKHCTATTFADLLDGLKRERHAIAALSEELDESLRGVGADALIGVKPRDAGVASALVNATQQVGGSLGTALLNTVATAATVAFLAAHEGSPAAQPDALVHGYTTAFTLSAALLAIAAVTSAVLIRASRRDVQPGEEPVEGELLALAEA